MSDFWLLAVRAIRARPLRSVLTASAVALGVAVVLAVQIAIQGLTVQAAEAQTEQAGASSLDVRVDIGSGLTPAQVTTLSELPGVVQAVPLYEKQVTAGPAGSSLEGATVTLVGLQELERSPAQRLSRGRAAATPGQHRRGCVGPGVEHVADRRFRVPDPNSGRRFS